MKCHMSHHPLRRICNKQQFALGLANIPILTTYLLDETFRHVTSHSQLKNSSGWAHVRLTRGDKLIRIVNGSEMGCHGTIEVL
jgi:hypothetical protein